ncbi:MAG: hypothetical protein ACK4U0_20955 [Mesorhizobium sp.]
MIEALRRAAIFLGYAFHASEIAPLKSVSLKAPIVLDVGVPDPIPPADQKGYQTEFKQWAIGQGLIEIDQCYNRYVVSAIDALADIDDFLMNRSLPGPRKPNMANTWKVHEQFYVMFGQHSPEHVAESGYLRSLVNARNCLAHDSGVVAKRRLVDRNSTMVVRWPGRDIFKMDQYGGRIVLQRDRQYRMRAEDIGSQLSVEDVVREYQYAEGDRIFLSQTDLSEIIFFYQILAMKIGSEMHRIVGERLAAANKA